MFKDKKIKDFDWEKEFNRNYSVESFQEVRYYWWKDCYNQIGKFVLQNIPLNNNSEILECGCGSGNSSLRLASLVKKITLLDSSDNALKCAKKLADYYRVKNAEFIKGDVFHMFFENNRFDFCWNIGLIEHYNFEQAKEIVKEMLRVTKSTGWMLLGVPNFKSLAIIKAKLLSHGLLRPLTFWIKGYRLGEEKKYNLDSLKRLIRIASEESGVKIEQTSFDYVGSVLPVETPAFIFKKIDKFFSRFFSRFSFLILVAVKINKP
ncbi:MAG: hypothetical protein COZ89_00220 [Candidatus Nealsonbacteria bacterium CG_4_8_14_3_um_filter_37_23]|nr:MAG: hypothetical protein COZ89_00220 [Candidatus Nealsonbacteria bacterium CG_4_8_14_3_um_filter_37_23]